MATANRVFDAPTQQQGPIPAYKIVEVPGPHKRQLSRFDEKTKQLVTENVIHDVGYMVYFPRGHCHMYFTMEALRNAGFGELVPLINMSSDSEINGGQDKVARVPIEKVEK